MNLQSFSVKQDIIFANGSINALAEQVKKLNGKKILLVTDPGLAEIGLAERVVKILDDGGVASAVFSDVDPDPGCWIVEKAVEAYKRENADTVVAVGGGSAMDTAKGVVIVGRSGKRVNDYAGYYLPVPHEVPPFICVPTTAGSGSEVTRNAVITDNDKYKMVVLNDKLLPKTAILDPELITTLPSSVAAATSMDALIHAVECYLSDLATPFSDATAEKAMELIGRSIRRFIAKRADVCAAGDMMMGSTLAGITLSLCLPNQAHALSHPLTGYYNIPHGLANAMLFPTTMEFNALADKGKYKKIYNILNTSNGGRYADDFHTDMLIAYLRKLNLELGLPRNLAAMGVSEEHLDAMVKDAQRTKIWLHCPRSTSPEEMRALYLKAMHV